VADSAEFNAFVRDSSRALQRTAWLLTGNWASAEDLVQAALLKTWTRWDRVDDSTAHAYARRVMLSIFLGWRTRRWNLELPLGWLPDAPREEPFDQLAVRAALITALHDLPRQQRAVVVLRYFEDLTETATAEALGCSVGTVKSHTARALATLRATPGLASLVDEGAIP
jgi:RNA polymerase sigma-70 factor (sigma-E family)